MANHASTKKSIRKIKRRTATNGARMGRMRTYVKKVELAIQTGDKEQAAQALRLAEPEMTRGARRGLLHSNTVSRKISRLSARIKSMNA